MTTPEAPGVPEAGQTSGTDPAPGAQDPAPQQEQPKPTPKPGPLGKPQATPGASQQPTSEPEPAKTDPQDISGLPEWAQKAIKEARAEAGKARTTAKQNAAEEARKSLLAEIGKTLGLNADDEPTVESLTQQLQERQARIDELEASQTEQNYRETVRAAATAANADPDALLDSNRFLDDVQAELGEEFTDDELTAAVNKVAKEYAKKPRFAKQAAPPRSGREITGGPPAPTKQRPRSLTEALGRAYGGGGN